MSAGHGGGGSSVCQEVTKSRRNSSELRVPHRASAGHGWRWLRGARSRPPQLVLLDHGAHVVLPERLRRSYCQLWTAFVTGDDAGAKMVRLGRINNLIAFSIYRLIVPAKRVPLLARQLWRVLVMIN